MVVERAGGGLFRHPPDPISLPRLRQVTREATRALGCERASLWWMERGGEQIRCVDRYLRTEGRHEGQRPYPDDLGRHTSRLLQFLSVLAMEDVRGGPVPARPLREYLEEEGVAALLAVPIHLEGALRGILCFEETEAPRVWTSDDRAEAMRLARRVVAIASAPEAQEISGSPADAAPELPGTDLPDAPEAPEPAERSPTPEPEGAAPDRTDEAGIDEPEPSDPGGPSPRGARREVQARMERLRPLEGSGILAVELAHELLHLLEVQDGFLALSGEASEAGGEEVELLREARRVGEDARSRMYAFLRWIREGVGERHPVELNALVGNLAVRLGARTGERVRLILSPSAEPLEVRCDPALLEAAVDHLVRNARDASPPDGRVRVRVLRGEGPTGSSVARLVVEDEGPGIDPAHLPWLFVPLFSTHGRRGARGMGLSVVQAVAEGHGGTVEVESTLGKGSRFSLVLPLLEGAAVGRAVPAGGGLGAGLPPDAPRVLLVEDDPHLARLLERALQRAGMDTRVVQGAVEAERAAEESAPRALDLLVVEWELPDGTPGGALIDVLRRRQPGLPAIVLDRSHRDPTTSPDEAARLEAGIPADVPLLCAPFDPADVVGLLRRGMRKGAARPVGGAG